MNPEPPNPEASFLEPHTRGAVLRLRVVPRAARDAVGDPLGDTLKVRLTAPPVEGRANRALFKFIGKILGLPPSRLELLTGKSARIKRILVTGVSPAWIVERLGFPGTDIQSGADPK